MSPAMICPEHLTVSCAGRAIELGACHRYVLYGAPLPLALSRRPLSLLALRAVRTGDSDELN